MIRTHSVSGDLHGVQPDPVAADILRKEPEHETFVRLNIAPNGIFLRPFVICALPSFLHSHFSFNFCAYESWGFQMLINFPATYDVTTEVQEEKILKLCCWS